ncbi:hypothetical protein DFH06DRAFT_1221201 [Mycena polygramma]|nr:hypothetical protein DFH06DRAFT_1221201 [Mycena polygramma]
MPPPPSRPSHRHSDSSPAIVFSPPADQPQKSSIFTSVRRNFSIPRRRDPVPAGPMYSTPAERNPYAPAFRYDPASARPTVEQIAMGLHLSRTPHLRGSPKYPAPASHPQPTQKAIPLPPPPARSSLKKTAMPPTVLLHGSTSSTTDVTSTTPSTPHSSDHSSVSLRARMSRFLPHRAHPTAASTPDSSALSSPRTSTSELHQPRKKAVRFTSTVVEED